MLRYRGTGLFYTLEGQCQDESVYTVSASVSFADQHSVLFAEEKMFGNGSALPGSFQYDFKDRQVVWPEKHLTMTYISPTESVGKISIQGNDFSLWRSIQYALIRNVLLGVDQILVEELHPVVDELADFSSEEKEVLDFVRQKATQLLDVNALIMIGSRADRTHTERSDYDIVVVGGGGPLSWNLLRDSVRHEAPTLADIEIIDASTVTRNHFASAIFAQGRFFHG